MTPAASAVREVGNRVDQQPASQREVARNGFTIPRTPVPIRFMDGEVIEVRIRPNPRLLDPRDVFGEYASFRHSAERGSGDAAYALYQALTICRDADRDADGVGAHSAAVCTGTPEEIDAEANKWLRAAVDAGNLYATKEHAGALGNSSSALEMYQKAWHLGHISSLGRIADLYYSGVSGDQELPSDRVKAVAYLWLQSNLQNAAAGQGRRDYVAILESRLHHRSGELIPHELYSADQLAKQILEDNPECCFGP